MIHSVEKISRSTVSYWVNWIYENEKEDKVARFLESLSFTLKQQTILLLNFI